MKKLFCVAVMVFAAMAWAEDVKAPDATPEAVCAGEACVAKPAPVCNCAKPCTCSPCTCAKKPCACNPCKCDPCVCAPKPCPKKPDCKPCDKAE